MRLSLPHLPQKRAARGFTLVELLVSSCLGIIVAAGTVLLLLSTGTENRIGLAEATIEQAAGTLENTILQRLREFSATEGAAFDQPALDESGVQVGFTRIIVARGPAPDYPREEVRFDVGSGRVIYDPNRAIGDNELLLGKSSTNAVLRLLVFNPTLKKDGTPDNGLINVSFRLDDNGFSRRHPGTGNRNAGAIWRTFSVRMRNN